MTTSTEDAPLHVIWGVTQVYLATGSEGAYWALQDIRGIDTAADPTRPRWSEAGVVVLRDGDELTIYAPESVAEYGLPADEAPLLAWRPQVLYQGVIWLDHRDKHEFRGHPDPAGLDQDTWADWFVAGLPARLLTRRPAWRVGELQLEPPAYSGILGAASPRAILFMSDGTVRWQLPMPEAATREAPYELRRFVHQRGDASR